MEIIKVFRNFRIIKAIIHSAFGEEIAAEFIWPEATQFFRFVQRFS